MKTIVLFGGNGYIGREVTKSWLEKESESRVLVLSRSGKNELVDARIENIAVNVADLAAVRAVLPDQVDYMIDLVGLPEKDPQIFEEVNVKPAQVMLSLAEEKDVKGMGFIGGRLGPKTFVEVKGELSQMLQESGIPTTVVEPTLVYGGGRKDTLSKLVPIFKVLGSVIPSMKPVKVEDVASELVEGMLNR